MIVQVVLGALVGAFLVLLVVGGLTRRLRLRSCCATADSGRDLRMRTPADLEDAGSDA